MQTMKRITDVYMENRCKTLKTALNRFFKKYPELSHYRDTFEYMAENNEDFESDQELLPDGSRDNYWSWALHLDIEENYYYIAIIERELK